MRNHIFYTEMNRNNLEQAKFKELKFFIRDTELDKLISEKFPLPDSDLNSNLLIEGSKELISCFEKVDEEKLDLSEELKYIDYVGLSDNREIILRFKNPEFGNEFNATGTYNFSFDFLDDTFQMGKYSKYCIDNGYNDLLRDNINELIEKSPELKKQYRLLKHNGEWLLRGITSTRYKNYDNHLAIYLALVSLHKYALINKITFTIERAFLSDSAIDIFFTQNKPISINNFGDIFFGVYVSNNEVRQGKFSMELRYTIVNKQQKKFSGISDFVFDLNHSTGLANIEKKLDYSNRIHELMENTLSYINSIKNSKLSQNQLYSIIKKILDSKQRLSKDARDKAKNYYDSSLIGNTLTIIEAFDKLSEITSDVDEKIYLERIYHDIMKDMSNTN